MEKVSRKVLSSINRRYPALGSLLPSSELTRSHGLVEHARRHHHHQHEPSKIFHRACMVCTSRGHGNQQRSVYKRSTDEHTVGLLINVLQSCPLQGHVQATVDGGSRSKLNDFYVVLVYVAIIINALIIIISVPCRCRNKPTINC